MYTSGCRWSWCCDCESVCAILSSYTMVACIATFWWNNSAICHHNISSMTVSIYDYWPPSGYSIQCSEKWHLNLFRRLPKIMIKYSRNVCQVNLSVVTWIIPVADTDITPHVQLGDESIYPTMYRSPNPSHSINNISHPCQTKLRLITWWPISEDRNAIGPT